MKVCTIAALALTFLLASVCEARAGLQLLYSESFTADATYTAPGGGTVTTPSPIPITISLSANTSSVMTSRSNFYVFGTATISSSLGSATFSDQFAVIDMPNGGSPADSITFADIPKSIANNNNPVFVVQGTASAFNSYNLLSPTGPVAVANTSGSASTTYALSNGYTVSFTSVSSASSFTAIPVPEPSTIALAMLGLGSLSIRLAGRLRKRAPALAN